MTPSHLKKLRKINKFCENIKKIGRRLKKIMKRHGTITIGLGETTTKLEKPITIFFPSSSFYKTQKRHT